MAGRVAVAGIRTLRLFRLTAALVAGLILPIGLFTRDGLYVLLALFDVLHHRPLSFTPLCSASPKIRHGSAFGRIIHSAAPAGLRCLRSAAFDKDHLHPADTAHVFRGPWVTMSALRRFLRPALPPRIKGHIVRRARNQVRAKRVHPVTQRCAPCTSTHAPAHHGLCCPGRQFRRFALLPFICSPTRCSRNLSTRDCSALAPAAGRGAQA